MEEKKGFKPLKKKITFQLGTTLIYVVDKFNPATKEVIAHNCCGGKKITFPLSKTGLTEKELLAAL
jgi:hypothetical protein